MTNRIVTGAHYGLRDWMIQRITAVIMAVYTLIMMVALCNGIASSAERWHAFFSHGLVRFATLLFGMSLCYHAWIGIRDIWMDYIKPMWLRVTLHTLTLLALIGCASWIVDILWRH